MAVCVVNMAQESRVGFEKPKHGCARTNQTSSDGEQEERTAPGEEDMPEWGGRPAQHGAWREGAGRGKRIVEKT